MEIDQMASDGDFSGAVEVHIITIMQSNLAYERGNAPSRIFVCVWAQKLCERAVSLL